MGHIVPALAVGEVFLDHGYEIFFIGRNNDEEKRAVESLGIPFYSIQTGKLRRYFSLSNVLDAFRVVIGFFQTLRILQNNRPLCLFSKGGFASVGPVWACKVLGVRVYSHESDSTPGLATKLNQSFSRFVFCGYKDCASLVKRGVYTSNPIRAKVLEADPALFLNEHNIHTDKPILLVLGGSQGSMAINEAIIEGLDILSQRFFIVHQTGKGKNRILDRPDYLSLEFIEDVGGIMKACYACVSRSGAGTISELVELNVPMVLVPMQRNASRGDQIDNARILEREHKAIVIDDISLLVQTIMSLKVHREQSNRAGANASRIIFDLIEEDLNEL